MVVGLMNNPTPFGGGTLVPIPILLLVPMTTDSDGEVSIPGIPGGGGPATFYIQVVYRDATLPLGFGISNALEVEILP